MKEDLLAFIIGAIVAIILGAVIMMSGGPSVFLEAIGGSSARMDMAQEEILEPDLETEPEKPGETPDQSDVSVEEESTSPVKAK